MRSYQEEIIADLLPFVDTDLETVTHYVRTKKNNLLLHLKRTARWCLYKEKIFVDGNLERVILIFFFLSVRIPSARSSMKV